MNRIVAINAISIKEGGALTVLVRLLQHCSVARPDWLWHVAANSVAAAEIPPLDQVCVHSFPAAERSIWRTRHWYEVTLPTFLRRVGADVLMSQTNYLPWRRLPCPSLLLVQHAGHFSPIYRELIEANAPSIRQKMEWRIKNAWVKSSVCRANHVTVQTQALASAIRPDTGLTDSGITVVPHGPGWATPGRQLAQPPGAGEPFRIGYVSLFGVQKNFSVLFRAVAELLRQGRAPKLILTLDPRLAQNRILLQEAEKAGIADVLENYGEVGRDAVGTLYRSLHAFVFPSLCESFGFPMLEAMAHGIPLLVADTESNAEIAGEGAQTFSPCDAENLAGMLSDLIQDPLLHRRRAEASLARIGHFSWDAAAGGTIALIEQITRRPQITP